MKTSMNIITIFFVAFLSISAISLAETSPLEACIRRNIARSLSPLPSNKPIIYHHRIGFNTPKIYHLQIIGFGKPKYDNSEPMGFDICSDEGRIVQYNLELNGKFPNYYVKALCNIFEDDDEKVKEYVYKNWFKNSNKLIKILSCALL